MIVVEVEGMSRSKLDDIPYYIIILKPLLATHKRDKINWPYREKTSPCNSYL
jgi:hypothetical protein